MVTERRTLCSFVLLSCTKIFNKASMTKRKQYSPEEKAAIMAASKCGKLAQAGVDEYTKLFDFPPQQIKGLEHINEATHAPTILGLVGMPTYKHWTLLDALNVVVLFDLKWRDPLKESRNMTPAETDALVCRSKLVCHGCLNYPSFSPSSLVFVFRCFFYARLGEERTLSPKTARVVACFHLFATRSPHTRSYEPVVL